MGTRLAVNRYYRQPRMMSLTQVEFDRPDAAATTAPQLRLLVPPDPKEAQAVRGRVSDFVRSLGVSDDVLYDVVTAVGEAFANAVQHAQTQDTIELTTWLDEDDKLLTRVVDRGCGFAPDSHPPRSPSESLAECGRGMWIINACADMLSVDSLPGLGTAIVFTRDLRRGGGAASRNR